METLWLKYDSWGSFPDSVNERAARLVALAVALISLASLLLGALWIAPLLAVGFLLRVWQGPRIDPLARVAVWVASRLFKEKEVDGPPKRFAQLLGFLLATAVSGLWLLGFDTGAYLGMTLLFLLASLESLGGICLGCFLFRGLLQRGIVPEEICRRCAG